MSKLSPVRAAEPVLKGLKLLHRGKVCDIYDLGSGLLLSVATDFDHILDTIVPGKGMIVTAMTHFWMTKLEEVGICKTHLVAAGSAIDHYLPEEHQKNIDLQCRALVVKQLQIVPVEFIARGYLTGPAFKEYQMTGKVFGVPLPEGLHDGDKLPFVFDTTTTKEVDGRDLPVDADEVRVKYPEETKTLLAVYEFVRDFAEKRGIIFADIKLVFGRDQDGNLVLGDEVAMPDSSRFWNADARWASPNELKTSTSEMYRYIFWLLTGMRVDSYVASMMKVKREIPKRRVAVVLGSESDRPEAEVPLAVAQKYVSNALLGRLDVHVLSCHRNPLHLVEFTELGCFGADVVVAVGGKEFALPGVLDAHLHANNWRIPVIGVAFGRPGSEEFLAAKLAISQIPGQTVVMDEKSGVYCGRDGLSAAIARATFSELPPILPRKEKKAKFFIKD